MNTNPTELARKLFEDFPNTPLEHAVRTLRTRCQHEFTKLELSKLRQEVVAEVVPVEAKILEVEPTAPVAGSMASMAKEFLRERLLGVEVEKKQLFAEAKSIGISSSSMELASKRLRVAKGRKAYQGPSYWSMPTMPTEPDPEEVPFDLEEAPVHVRPISAAPDEWNALLHLLATAMKQLGVTSLAAVGKDGEYDFTETRRSQVTL